MREKARLGYLDSFRGIAAFSVFFSHYYGAFPTVTIPRWATFSPLSFFRDGFGSVAMFFVLSGFVLTFQHFQKDSDFDLRKNLLPFVIARWVRIYLPFLVALFISIGCLLIFGNDHSLPDANIWFTNIWAEPLTLNSIAKQAALFVNIPFDPMIPQSWTLSIELLASMLMPFLTLIASKTALGFIFFIILNLKKRWFLFHFAAGILIAKYYSNLEKYSKQIPSLHRVVLFVISLYFYTWYFSRTEFYAENLAGVVYDHYWYIMGIGSAGIIVLTMGSTKLKNFFEWGPLTYLGRISYSIYLIHFIVLKTVSVAIFSAGIKYNIAQTTSFKIAAMSLTVISVILMAEIFYRFVEVPLIHLGRRTYQKVYLTSEKMAL